jgi:hypothetical protein
MGPYNEMLDLSHCVRKEAAFSAKAKAATDPLLRSTYEAAAREYAYRAMLLKETKKKA